MWKFFPGEVTLSTCCVFIHKVITKQQEQLKLFNNVEIEKKKKVKKYVSQSAALQYGTDVENVVTSCIR